jgi:phosphatidate cytidylyltransferase
MLRTRIITAVVLLAVLLAVVWSGSMLLFNTVIVAFFAAAAWESLRLFRSPYPAVGAALWSLPLAYLLLPGRAGEAQLLLGLSAALWLIRFAPTLALGLPAIDRASNRLLGWVYVVSLLGCFVAMALLYRERSALYLLSVMAIVWIADIGAYFSGKAFGRRKLAPSISPGKSWEGAIGGWLAVLTICSLSTLLPQLSDTFAAHARHSLGWLGLAVALTLLTAISVVGDLFESMLKRRIGMKDSSHLLPGHGGVLDRIDALIPVMPMAALLTIFALQH